MNGLEYDFSDGQLILSCSDSAEDVYGDDFQKFDFPFDRHSTIEKIVHYKLSPSGALQRSFDVIADGNSENIYSPYDQDDAIKFASWKNFPTSKKDIKGFLIALAEKKRKELDDILKFLDGIDAAQEFNALNNEPDFETYLEKTEPHYDRDEAEDFPIYDIISYAKNVIKGRWISAETYMLNRPFLIGHMKQYAEEVIRGPWPELEELKKQHPEEASKYNEDE